MNFCVRCGAPLAAGARFCGQCGQQVGQQVGQETARAGTQTYPRSPSGAHAGPGGAQAFAAGDWAGALSTAGIGVGSMLGLALFAYLLADTGTDSSRLLSSIAIYTALAAGGTVKAAGFAGDVGLNFRPLGVTALGFGLMGLFFVRRLRRQGQPTLNSLLMQAGRTAVVLLGALLVVALIGRNRAQAEAVGAAGTQVDVPSTLFFGALTLAVALAVAVTIGVPGVLTGRAEQVRAAVAAPLRATLIALLAACVITAVVLALWERDGLERTSLASASQFWREFAGSMLLLAPNYAGAALLFGLGVPATGVAGIGLPGTAGSSGAISVLTLTDHDQLFWLWPLTAAVLLLLAAFLAARRTSPNLDRRSSVLWFGGVLAVVMFALSLSLSAGAWVGALAGLSGGRVGFDALLALVYGAVWGAAAALIASVAQQRRQVAVAPYPGP